MKTIVYTKAAAKDLDALPVPAREAVEMALDAFAVAGRGDVKALQGVGGYRLRVGAYRFIFHEDLTTILAVNIGRRSTTTYRKH